MKILIIEDNAILSKNIWKFLVLKWFKSDISSSAELALEKIKEERFLLVILDLNLPWMDWLTFLSQIRKNNDNVPVLILTSRSSNEDMVKWLNLWADDYISKPFDYDIFLARINAILRKNSLNKSEIIEIKDIKADLLQKKVFVGSKEIILSNLEFELFKFLLRNRWKVLTRLEIYENVWWEFDNYMFSRVVDIYIWYLRKKLWKDTIQTKIWAWYFIN